MVRSPSCVTFGPRCVPVRNPPHHGHWRRVARRRSWATASGAIPSKRGELPSVDDHSQPESRPRSTGDCSAAECLQPQSPIDDYTPVEPTTAEASLPSDMRPFVWQCGRRLLMLEREQGMWVLADLRFEPEICRYSELRRAYFRWEREAVGALLSRTIGCGEDAAAESAELLDDWMERRR